MDNHLSDSVLDQILLGKRVDPHLDQCEPCRARLRQFSDARTAAGPAPASQRTVTRVRPSGQQQRRTRWRWWSAGALTLSAAAGLALVVLLPEGNRTQGPPSLSLRRSADATGPLRAGERVALLLGTGGHPFALVVMMTPAGEVERLWPLEGAFSGTVPAKVVELKPEFEVTPGPVLLEVLLSDQALVADKSLALLRAEVRTHSERARQLTPIESLEDDVKAQASLRLDVADR